MELRENRIIAAAHDEALAMDAAMDYAERMEIERMYGSIDDSDESLEAIAEELGIDLSGVRASA